MAAFDTTRPAVDLSAGRLVRFITNITGALATWNDARITAKSLSQLSARELDDIGLTRADIPQVASRVTR